MRGCHQVQGFNNQATIRQNRGEEIEKIDRQTGRQTSRPASKENGSKAEHIA
jgi:hypothetical protein